jgi:hypothetical protein
MIEDLISFYVRENYAKYLKENNIDVIQDDKIREAVNKIYLQRKDHLKTFLKSALKEMMKDDYIGDLVVLNICNDIFNDDDLCINRISREIQLYQK